MNNVLKKLNDISEFKESLNEDFRVDIPSEIDIIKELQETNWSKKKRFKRLAMKKLAYIAESDDPACRAFFRGLDKATTKVGNIVLKKIEEGYFKNDKQI